VDVALYVFIKARSLRSLTHLLSVRRVLQRLGFDEVVVDVLLHVGQLATNDLNQLGGKVLGVQRVDPPEDELVHDGRHVVLLVEHLLLLPIGGVRLAAPEDGGAVERSKLFLRFSEDVRVGEVHHCVELLEVVLHRRPREEDAALAGEGGERHGRLGFAVLEAVGLVTDEEVTGFGLRRAKKVPKELSGIMLV